MKVVLFHLTGNANVKAAAYGLAKANLLAEYNVTIASFPGSAADKLSGFSPFSEIGRRRLDPILKPFTRTWPWMEMGRVILPKIKLSRLTNHVTAPFFVDAVVRNIDKRVAKRLRYAQQKGATAIYGYEDTTIQAFRRGKELGMQCLYDLPIGYWRAAQRLLEPEREKWPEWASTITILNDPEQKLKRKEEELNLADHVFVASSFTKKTLQDYEGKTGPVHVIPYGFPEIGKEIRKYNYTGNRRLKLLFVGSLSQRKGIANLFAAVRPFREQIQLTLVGRKGNAQCSALDNELAKHKWIPSLSHKEVLQLMWEHDVLVFPSLFEGFGLVITEAMSQGTPVITTERTAGPDLIRNNENGWIVNAGSTPALQAAIEQLFSHPQMIASAGEAAVATARQRPWEKYGEELAECIRKCV